MISRSRYYYLFLYFYYHMGQHVNSLDLSDPVPRVHIYLHCSRSPVPRGQGRHSEATYEAPKCCRHDCNGTGLVSHWQDPSSRFPDRLARIISSPTARAPLALCRPVTILQQRGKWIHSPG